MDEFLEHIWSELLSRDPVKVRSTFSSLDTGSQQEVILHLTRMTTESGWHPEQVTSARIALGSLKTE